MLKVFGDVFRLVFLSSFKKYGHKICLAIAFMMSNLGYVHNAYAAFDPNAFTTLGVLNVPAGETLTLDSTANTYTVSGGGPSGSGVLAPQSGGLPTAVFTFSSIDIDPSATVLLQGTDPIALLSQGTANILSNITVDNATLGGGSGALVEYTSGVSAVGGGAGGGGANPDPLVSSAGAGGGGDGGAGGNSNGGNPIQGGSAGTAFVIGDNSRLAGGGGGGAGGLSAIGGDGGGSIQITSIGDMTISNIIALSTNGQPDTSPFLHGGGGGGGGGSIVVGSTNGTLTNIGAFVAIGGNGGNAGGKNPRPGGGGAGGGQIAIQFPSYTLATPFVPLPEFTSTNVNGGTRGLGESGEPNGSDGEAGVIIYAPQVTFVPDGFLLDSNTTFYTLQAPLGNNVPEINLLLDSVTVEDGGTLTGYGNLNNVVINDGGLWIPNQSNIPPNSPNYTTSTQTLRGNIVINSGGSLVLTVNENSADNIIAAGTATFGANSSLALVSNLTSNPTRRYTLITANGGIIGQLGSVQTDLAFLRPVLTYDANNVYLSFLQPTPFPTPNPLAPGQTQTQNIYQRFALNINQFNFAVSLDNIFSQFNGQFNAMPNSIGNLFSLINTLRIPEVPTAYQTLANTNIPSVPFVLGQNLSNYLNRFNTALFYSQIQKSFNLTNNFNIGRVRFAQVGMQDLPVALFRTQQKGWWLEAFREHDKLTGNDYGPGYSSHSNQFAGGLNFRTSCEPILMSMAFGSSQGKIKWDPLAPADAKTRLYFVTVGSSYIPEEEGFYTTANATLGNGRIRLTRYALIGPFSFSIASKPRYFMGNIQLEEGYNYHCCDNQLIQPYFSLSGNYIRQRHFIEQSNIGSLAVNKMTASNILSNVGLRYAFALNESASISLETAWTHRFSGISNSLTATLLGVAQPFTVYSSPVRHDGIRGALSLFYPFNCYLGSYVTVQAEGGNHATSYSGSLGISGRF